MKKTFSRFMALLLTFTMLFGMAAAAEPVMTTKGHAILNWLGDVVDATVVQTTDEDGCTRFDIAISENGAELIKAFLQIGQALTFGTSAEEAITITPEAIEQAVTLIASMLEGQVDAGEAVNGMSVNELMGAAEQYAEIAAAYYELGKAYAESGDLEADINAVSNLLVNEVNRLMQVAALMGGISATETGALRIELNETVIAKILTMYVAMLGIDNDVMNALTALKIWGYLGMAEAAEEIVKQLFAQLSEMAGAMSAAIEGIENHLNIVVVIGEAGVHAEISCTEDDDTTVVVADYDGAALQLTLDEEAKGGNYYTHLTATIAQTGDMEVKVSGKDYENEAEIYVLVSGDTAYADVKTMDGAETQQVTVSASSEGTIVNYTRTKGETVLDKVAVVVNEAGVAVDYAEQSETSDGDYTVGKLTISAAGINWNEEEVEYGVKINAALTVDFAAMSLDFAAVDDEGTSVAIRANPSIISLNVVADDAALDCALTIGSETEMTLKASLTTIPEGEVLMSMDGVVTAVDENTLALQFSMFIMDGDTVNLTGTVDLANCTVEMEADGTVEGLAVHAVIFEKYDIETLSYVESMELTVGDETHTIVEEACPVTTESMYAYSFKVTMDGKEMESVLVGLRNLEPENADSVHGELFIDVKENLAEVEGEEVEEALNLALEFIIKEGNPTSIDLLFKTDDQVAGTYSSVTEITAEEAPAHISGYALSGEEIAQLIMSLIAELAA